MKYKVLGPRILVRVRKTEEKSEGGIVLTADYMEQQTITQTTGEVMQIGPTVKTEYSGFEDLNVGDKVHFQRYGAMRVGIKDSNDVEHWIINGKDVLCIETEEKEVINND